MTKTRSMFICLKLCLGQEDLMLLTHVCLFWEESVEVEWCFELKIRVFVAIPPGFSNHHLRWSDVSSFHFAHDSCLFLLNFTRISLELFEVWLWHERVCTARHSANLLTLVHQSKGRGAFNTCVISMVLLHEYWVDTTDGWLGREEHILCRVWSEVSHRLIFHVVARGHVAIDVRVDTLS